jgi:hypothetical protein
VGQKTFAGVITPENFGVFSQNILSILFILSKIQFSSWAKLWGTERLTLHPQKNHPPKITLGGD